SPRPGSFFGCGTTTVPPHAGCPRTGATMPQPCSGRHPRCRPPPAVAAFADTAGPEDPMPATVLDRFIADLRAAVTGVPDPAARAVPLARALAADRSWIRPEFHEVDPAQGFGIVVLHEEPDGS